MYTKLKEEVLAANKLLKANNLVKLTWGNVSQYDRDLEVIAIKPSGVDYDNLNVDDIVVVDIDANIIEGVLKPSSDLLSHLEIYRNFEQINGITHTHSTYATAFSQAKKEIITYGTTHADHFHNNIPVSRDLSKEEVEDDYELNTGKVIVESLNKLEINPLHTPAILVPNHAPFIFGGSAEQSVINAIVLEEVAKMAYLTINLNHDVISASQHIISKHFNRKHGKDSYYGQD